MDSNLDSSIMKQPTKQPPQKYQQIKNVEINGLLKKFTAGVFQTAFNSSKTFRKLFARNFSA